MDNIRRKRDFIYKFDGIYYLIGYAGCRVCQDEALILLYNDFEDLIICINTDYNNYSPINLSKKERGNISDKIILLLNVCSRKKGNGWDEESTILAEKLLKQFEYDWNSQLKEMEKALTCVDLEKRNSEIT